MRLKTQKQSEKHKLKATIIVILYGVRLGTKWECRFPGRRNVLHLLYCFEHKFQLTCFKSRSTASERTATSRKALIAVDGYLYHHLQYFQLLLFKWKQLGFLSPFCYHHVSKNWRKSLLTYRWLVCAAVDELDNSVRRNWHRDDTKKAIRQN